MSWSIIAMTFTYQIGKCWEHRCRGNLRLLEKMALSGDFQPLFLISRTCCPNMVSYGNSVLRAQELWLKRGSGLHCEKHLSKRPLKSSWLGWPLKWGKPRWHVYMPLFLYTLLGKSSGTGICYHRLSTAQPCMSWPRLQRLWAPQQPGGMAWN